MSYWITIFTSVQKIFWTLYFSLFMDFVCNICKNEHYRTYILLSTISKLGAIIFSNRRFVGVQIHHKSHTFLSCLVAFCTYTFKVLIGSLGNWLLLTKGILLSKLRFDMKIWRQAISCQKREKKYAPKF